MKRGYYPNCRVIKCKREDLPLDRIFSCFNLPSKKNLTNRTMQGKRARCFGSSAFFCSLTASIRQQNPLAGVDLMQYGLLHVPIGIDLHHQFYRGCARREIKPGCTYRPECFCKTIVVIEVLAPCQGYQSLRSKNTFGSAHSILHQRQTYIYMLPLRVHMHIHLYGTFLEKSSS